MSRIIVQFIWLNSLDQISVSRYFSVTSIWPQICLVRHLIAQICRHLINLMCANLCAQVWYVSRWFLINLMCAINLDTFYGLNNLELNLCAHIIVRFLCAQKKDKCAPLFCAQISARKLIFSHTLLTLFFCSHKKVCAHQLADNCALISARTH